MKVMVTGGSGLFGRKTCIHLLRDKDVDTVVSMDIVPPRDWFMKAIEKYKDKFHYVRGDVSQIEDFLNAMKSYKIDKLVNWAFFMGEQIETNPRLAIKINALGMNNAFEAARLMGVNRVIYASSETVYGPQDEYGEREVTEDDRLMPAHSYALCKRLAEVTAASYHEQYGINFTALRPTIGFGYGAYFPPGARDFSDLVSLAAVGKPAIFDVDGTHLISPVSSDDLAEFTRILLHAKSSPHPAYNVGGPPASMQDVAKAVLKYIPNAKIKFGKQSHNEGGGRRGLPWLVSTARAKEDFGFSCMPLEEAVLIHINDARLEAGLDPLKV
jgi:nucleoside-diphosphate-sugar epimerase